MSRDAVRHAGLIARRVAGRWRGVLIEGPSGGGKSDLALRALGEGFRLVADDRVVLWASGGRLYGRAPDTLSGLIEVRGVGIVVERPVDLAEVALIARLGTPERLPEAAFEHVMGVRVPVVVVDPFEASAPAKLGRALLCFDAAHKRRM